jgi:hypothetical protein
MTAERADQGPSLYVAVLLYESASAAPGYLPLYEECFVLIKAGSPEEACEKALHHARCREVSYQNEKKETIRWSLKQVVDVSPALDDSLDDGSEIYARHFRNHEAYRSFEPLLSGESLGS